MNELSQHTPDATPEAGIRKLFFTYRNGIIADTLRKGGIPHKTVFGLQLPQISAIARETGTDSTLGRKLWNERDCRESRLLACHMICPDDVGPDEALDMALDCRSREETDILAFRLLRRLDYAVKLLEKLRQSPDAAYAAEALARNLT